MMAPALALVKQRESTEDGTYQLEHRYGTHGKGKKREKDRKKKKKKVSAGFSKALRCLKTMRKWEDVTHQLLSLESIPAGTCPLDNCFKFGKQVSFT